MKFSMIAVVSLGVVVASALADEKATPKAASSEFKDVRQKASYGIGLLFGKSLLTQGVNLDNPAFLQGLNDAIARKPARLSEPQIKEAIDTYQLEVQARKTKEGKAFLAENKTKKDVKTTASGLQYKEIKAGTGKTPKVVDTVLVKYEGRLIDNTIFDNSNQASQGNPVSFPVADVKIQGFAEALQLMKVGSVWQLYIPPELAYGATPPPGGVIGPNVPLIFDLELVDVKDAPK